MVSVFQRRQYVGITKWCHEISKIPGSRKVKHLDFRPFGSVHFVGTTCRCLLALGPSKSECETGRRSGWSLSTHIRVISPASSPAYFDPKSAQADLGTPVERWWDLLFIGDWVPNQKAFPKISPTFPADFYLFWPWGNAAEQFLIPRPRSRKRKPTRRLPCPWASKPLKAVVETAPISFIVEESEVQHKKLEERSCCLLKTWRKVEGSYCLTDSYCNFSNSSEFVFQPGRWCPHEVILQPEGWTRDDLHDTNIYKLHSVYWYCTKLSKHDGGSL